MPEGPEVKYLTDFLNNNLKNEVIYKITINGGRYNKHGPPKGFNKFIKELPLRINSINCYGKFMWWEFENSNLTLWNTLGMSGWWNFNEELKHNNLSFFLKDDENNILNFNDVRNFGTFIFCDKESLNKKLSKFGPDILEFDPKNQEKGLNLFKKKIEKKRGDMYIASALLDQGVAAGCGNYIRAEVLYLAKISPFRKLEDLTDNEIKLIWNLLQQVAYHYYNKKLGKKLGIIDGKFKFAEDYKKQFLVYTQDKDINGNKVIHEKIKDRTIHYVPKIQK